MVRHPPFLVSSPHSLGPIAKDHDFDVVLIDTAGRMQDNEVTCSSTTL
jgi:hypothetical protein